MFPVTAFVNPLLHEDEVTLQNDEVTESLV